MNKTKTLAFLSQGFDCLIHREKAYHCFWSVIFFSRRRVSFAVHLFHLAVGLSDDGDTFVCVRIDHASVQVICQILSYLLIHLS